MKCPNCGFEMQEEQLYCENCGTEIQIVPDFEPEIENSISETLTTLAEELTEGEGQRDANGVIISKEMPPEEDLFLEEVSIFEKILSNRKLFLGCTFALVCAAILLFLTGFFVFQHNSKGYQVSRAIEYADQSDYEKAIACLRAAENIDSTDASIYFLMADYYYLMGMEEEAVNTLKNIALAPVFEADDIENAYTKIISIYKKNEDYQAINDLLLACTDQDIIYMFQNYMAYPPEFSYIEGTYQEIVPLKLSSNTSGKIYYTTDGSRPDENSITYTTPIFLETGVYEISAFFINDYGIKSEVVSNTYVIELTVPTTPEISIYSGEYTEPAQIEVAVPENCKVYYTVDGSEPTDESTQYTEPVPMPLGTTHFKFIAYSKEGVSGEVIARTYTLKPNAQYSVNDALSLLSVSLVKQGYILDLYGNKEGIQGRYIYKMGTVYRVTDGQDYYFIYEYYEDLAENQSKTGRIFGVNIMTGACGAIGLDEKWNYYFAPFEETE